MGNDVIQKLTLATKLLNIIVEFAEQGEDYKTLAEKYNYLVEEYLLPLRPIWYVSNTEFDFL